MHWNNKLILFPFNMQQFMQAMLYKMQLSFFENIVLDFNKNMHSN